MVIQNKQAMNKEELLKVDPKAELRFIHNVEARAEGDGERIIAGEAATIDSVTTINDGYGGQYEEVIRRGAFDSTVNGDIRIVKNHSADLLLARSKDANSTGRVFINDRGNLAFEAPVRDSRSHSVDTYDEILSGDIDGCSFMFRVGKESWTFPNEENGRSIALREILDFESILDVGPVTYPAYESTQVIARSLSEASKKPNLLKERKVLHNKKHNSK